RGPRARGRRAGAGGPGRRAQPDGRRTPAERHRLPGRRGAARRGARAPGAPSVPAGEPRPSDIAYLAGGARLAVYSSLGALRAAGAVEAAPGGTVAVTGPPPARARGLHRA